MKKEDAISYLKEKAVTGDFEVTYLQDMLSHIFMVIRSKSSSYFAFVNSNVNGINTSNFHVDEGITTIYLTIEKSKL